jgi:mannosyltransferase OCH1-like enzyme
MIFIKKKNYIKNIFYIILIVVIILIILYKISKYTYENFNNLEEENILLNIPKEHIKTINITENNKPNEIPLNLFMCWKTKNLPPSMNKLVNKIIEENPDFKIYIFDDGDCRNMIEKYFIQDVVDAFDNLVPGAYKADLWRYCVLYLYGGIYQDIKYEPVNGFKYKELVDKEYFVKDRKIGGEGIYNALMVCKKNNTILEKAIKSIVKNVKNKYYGTNPLSPTGPLLLKLFFSQSDIDKLVMKFNEDSIFYNEKKILLTYNAYRDEQKKYGTPHYNDLWHTKKIYNK